MAHAIIEPVDQAVERFEVVEFEKAGIDGAYPRQQCAGIIRVLSEHPVGPFEKRAAFGRVHGHRANAFPIEQPGGVLQQRLRDAGEPLFYGPAPAAGDQQRGLLHNQGNQLLPCFRCRKQRGRVFRLAVRDQ